MLDIRYIRENTQYVKERLAARGKNLDEQIDKIIALDDERKALILSAETKKAEQNKINKSIPQLKKAGEDISAIMAQMKALSEQVKNEQAKLGEVEKELNYLLLITPNVPCDKVPVGKDAEDNVVVRSWGEPKHFEYEPKAHWDIGADLDIIDQPRGVKVAGTRFNFLKGAGAKLERALISFYLDVNTGEGFKELMTPYLANSKTLTGTAQLPKFAEDMFKIENSDYYLISTAEIPVTNYHADEILEGEQLPLYYTAYTPCFRAEAGAAGRDTRGLIRVHQFDKVEIVKFTKPEDSMEELEKLVAVPEKILQALGLPYRVVICCTGDMGGNQVMQYDLEVWMPSYNKYVEISSCSNYWDYQARRANIKFKREKGAKAEFVHTLNGSSLACPRALAAILENFQNEDGTVNVPEVLVPYMGGMKVIK
ncbi:MAG: serine--tRNA ligase [Ruminococcaceae bacterium]|nr:serine--tRNA ligase [Oscillospiraceae bacterium]MBQ6836142.1 serine--tRNA ligase [Clostridia bacterium]